MSAGPSQAFVDARYITDAKQTLLFISLKHETQSVFGRWCELRKKASEKRHVDVLNLAVLSVREIMSCVECV
jgi:hypothetical protein